MICANNDFRCHQQGYCNCYQGNFSEAAVGTGGVLGGMLVGIPATFLYPAYRIFYSDIEYEMNGPSFVGGKWLAASPVFGIMSNMLYQVIFALGACVVTETLQSKITNSIYIGGQALIFTLAIGLAYIAFLIKNRKAIKLFIFEAETRTIKKWFGLAGTAFMGFLAAFAGLGVVFAVTDTYFIHQTEIQAGNNQQNKLISAEIAKYDSYIGKYKLTAREDSTLFQIMKSSDGKNLTLNSILARSGEQKNDSGCLLSPVLYENSIYYSVSDCIVNGKQSPLGKVYFRTEKGKVKMSFIYNVNASSDTLIKIK